LRLPVFASGRVPVLIVTTQAGARRLRGQKPRDWVKIRAARSARGELAPRAILGAVARETPGRRILVEGGPRLLASFFHQRLIAEQFLTLAPQLAGRELGDGRLGLVMGEAFAPRNPRWARLTDVRRGHSHLFLRYSFHT
jgi:riboflavin biosynthesis pyrimidine reductase